MSHRGGIGALHSNILILLDSDRIYYWFLGTDSVDSKDMKTIGWQAIPFNFKDLGYIKVGSRSFPVVPANKYRHQQKCELGWVG